MFHLSFLRRLGRAGLVVSLTLAGGSLLAQNPPAAAAPAAANTNFDPHDLGGVFWGRLARGVAFSLSAKAPPMTPWAQERYDAAKPGLGARGKPLGNDPIMICDPMGYPRIMFWTGYPFEIIQLKDRTLMFFDWFYTYRTIWTDGRKLEDDPDPRFYGSAVGHWEGDTFVVDSKGYDDRAWLDADGHPHSEDMTLQERWKRTDKDTIEISMTLTDPKAYTQPWVSEKVTLSRNTEKIQMREDVCIPSVEMKYKEQVRNPAGTPKK
jgi:hypothetical protein